MATGMVEMPVKSFSDTMAEPQAPSSLETEIDERIAKHGENVAGLIQELCQITLPPDLWSEVEFGANPLDGSLEPQFWHWNRAAVQTMKAGRIRDAVEIWAAMYLAFLSLQLRYRLRCHKGLPLLNMGIALGKLPNARDLQVKCCLLGLLEDVLTYASDAPVYGNYRNLRSMPGIKAAVLERMMAAIHVRFNNQGNLPLYPETCMELWFDPTVSVPSKACITKIERLESLMRSSLPKLPTEGGSYIMLLEQTWNFSDWSKGIIRDE